MKNSTRLKQKIVKAIDGFRTTAFYTVILFALAAACVILVSSNFIGGAVLFCLALLSLLWLTPIPFYRKVAKESEKSHSQNTYILKLCKPKVSTLILFEKANYRRFEIYHHIATDVCILIKDRDSKEWYLFHSTSAQTYGVKNFKKNLQNGTVIPRIYADTRIVKDFVIEVDEGKLKEVNPFKRIIDR